MCLKRVCLRIPFCLSKNRCQAAALRSSKHQTYNRVSSWAVANNTESRSSFSRNNLGASVGGFSFGLQCHTLVQWFEYGLKPGLSLKRRGYCSESENHDVEVVDGSGRCSLWSAISQLRNNTVRKESFEGYDVHV